MSSLAAVRLVAPTHELWPAWREAHDEWGPGEHEDGFGLLATDFVDDVAGFSAWVSRLHAARDRCTYRWIVDEGAVLGAIAVRRHDDGFGHVGYGIRPTARGRGLATWAFSRMLDHAWATGFDEVVAVCAVNNDPSSRVIEKCGGVLAAVSESTHTRRYVITAPHDPRDPMSTSPIVIT